MTASVKFLGRTALQTATIMPAYHRSEGLVRVAPAWRGKTILSAEQIEALLGYTVDEWLSDRNLFVDLLHPDDRDRILSEVARTNRSADRLAPWFIERSRGRKMANAGHDDP